MPGPLSQIRKGEATMHFQILNSVNRMKMGEATTFEDAIIQAQRLADLHQQRYTIFELIHHATVSPKLQPPDPAQ